MSVLDRIAAWLDRRETVRLREGIVEARKQIDSLAQQLAEAQTRLQRRDSDAIGWINRCKRAEAEAALFRGVYLNSGHCACGAKNDERRKRMLGDAA
jgi:hypothetical protein